MRAVLLMLLASSCGFACADDASTGVVEGRVVYRADPERPWRYSRFYVDRTSSSLAEAVVALSSPSLRGHAPRSEPQELKVDQENFRFVPETTAIRAGDRVRFTNSDTTIHNVKTGDGIDPFNVNISTGEAHTQTFRRAGGTRRPIRLGCSYHGGMTAWIYVFDHPFYTVTMPDGRFRFAGVPPGEYTLESVHPSGELTRRDIVTVTAGEAVEIEIEISPDDKAKAAQ